MKNNIEVFYHKDTNTKIRGEVKMEKSDYKYYLVFVVENGNVREVQENIEVDYHTYIETFEKVRD